MRNIKNLHLVVLVTLGLSALGASPSAAAEFVFSKTGKLTGQATTTQEFKTGGGATLDCTKVTPSGSVTELKFTKLNVSMAYSSCTVSGIGSASVTTGEYTLLAPPGENIVNTPITAKASALGVKCTLVIDEPQTVGQEAGEIAYENASSTIVVNEHIGEIASEVTESNSSSLCGIAGEKDCGTWNGKTEIDLEGGTLQYSGSGGSGKAKECTKEKPKEESKPEFKAEKGKYGFTPLVSATSSKQTFKLEKEDNVSCEEVTFETVKLEKALESIEIKPVFVKKCTATLSKGGYEAEVKRCGPFQFYANGEAEAKGECEIEVPGIKNEKGEACKITFETATGSPNPKLTGLTYKNEPDGANKQVGVTAKLTGYKYAGSSWCKLEVPTGKKGEYEGSLVMRAPSGEGMEVS